MEEFYVMYDGQLFYVQLLVAVITWKNNAQCVMSIMYQHGAHPEN
jgi:hypothetical protein